MKGLLIKDLLCLKNYKKSFIVSLVMAGFIGFVDSEVGNVIGIVTIMFGFMFSAISTSTFAYDELSNSEKYILTLPVSKKDILLSKYIFSILCLLCGILMGMILGSILTLTLNGKIINLDSDLSTIMGGFIVCSFMLCIQIPCIYKYGVEKGRVQALIFMTLIISVIIGIYFLLNKIGIIFDFSNFGNYFVIVFLIISVFMYYISFIISKKIYYKKEL